MNFKPYRHYYRGYFFDIFKHSVKAIEEYQLTLQHDPQFFKASSALAHLHAAQEQYQEAERYFIDVVKRAPDNAALQFNLGYVYDRQGKREQAIACFNEAVRLKPKLDRAWYGMGLAHATLGRHDEAAKALEEAARLQPMNTHAWYALGMAHHHLRNPDRVKEVVLYLHRIGPLTCRQLIKEAERSDLAYLVKDLSA